jgi:hypothetical protein
VHRTTLERWAKVGIRGGIKLETALLGATRVSSIEAVERFIARLNDTTHTTQDVDGSATRRTRTTKQRQRASDDAVEALKKRGY